MKNIYAVFYKTIFYIIGNLPSSILYKFSDILSFVVQYIIKYRVNLVEKNLETSNLDLTKKEIIQIKKNFYKHFCDLTLEIIKLDFLNEREIKKRFSIRNKEITNKFFKKNKSAILMVSHYGGYEWCAALGYFLNHDITAIYTPLKNKALEKVIYESRTKHNMKLISRYNAISEIANLQNNNNIFIYGMVADQSPQIRSKNYWTNFLGVHVPVFTGSERLAKKHNIPVVFGKINKPRRGKYEMEIKLIAENPNDFKDFEITEKYLRLVEEQIKDNPSHYLWTHNRFKHKKSI